MSAEKKKQMRVLGLIVALVVTLVGSLVFVGAVSGWLDDPKVTIDAEYRTETPEMRDLSAEGYEEMIGARKSFVVFVDQGGCTTADRLRGYVEEYMEEKGLVVFKMMFAEMKKTTLNEKVKYYPSVAIIDRGKVKVWLRADSDEDAEMYNDYAAFAGWMGGNLSI